LVRKFDPDIVIATEVGMCELAAMLKRESDAGFGLVAAPGLDIDRAWAQPEVDLYLSGPDEVAAQLVSAGAPPAKILHCGLPIDPAFESLPDRATARARLQLKIDVPVLLVLFGGAGYGKPARILRGLVALPDPLQIICLTGMNPHLEEKLRRECDGDQRFRVLSWVNNVHEWMAAADLLLSKPGETTVAEAMATGLPILAFDPLPGAEQRTCGLIEKWRTGCFVRRPEHLGPLISRLLTNRAELRYLQDEARKIARPGAACAAARTIIKLRQVLRALPQAAPPPSKVPAGALITRVQQRPLT
jgi:processive 1,2-diacylglycerol beta-glucosyltransferase